MKDIGNQKKKSLGLRSMKSKLMASLLVISIVPTSVLGIVSQKNASDSLKEKQTKNALELTEQVSTSIDKYASGIGAQVNMLTKVSTIQTSLNDKTKEKQVNELLKNVKESRPDILSAYFASTDKKMNLYPYDDLPADYDPTSRDWYKLSLLNKGKITLNEPYQDVGTGDSIVTVSQTVENNGQIVGVIGFDVSLKSIQQEIQSTQVGEKGFVFMTDTKGTLVAHPDDEKLGKDISSKKYWNDVEKKASGSTLYEYKGKEHLLTFYTDKKSGWKFLSSIPMDEINEDIVALNKIIIGLVLLFSTIATGLAWFISRRISSNITSIKEVVEKASKGDLTVRANVKSKDELNELSDSFNKMLDSINHTMKEATTLSSKLLDSSNNLTEMTKETTDSVLQVSEAVGQIAEGSVISSENTQNSVSEIADLSNNLDMISNSSNQMALVSDNSTTLSNDGLKQVVILTQKSELAKASSIEAGEIVKNMDKNVEEINKIMQTILAISDQTNLLSLNASIEAARAGEQGKGFAVVASEIRNLADQSKKSASEIQSIISRIIGNSKEAVTAIERNDSMLNEQLVAVEDTKNIFNQIVDSIEDVKAKVEQVQQHVKESEVKKENVFHEMESISAVAEQTAGSAQEVFSTTEEISAMMEEYNGHATLLNDMANKLKESIDKFKIK